MMEQRENLGNTSLLAGNGKRGPRRKRGRPPKNVALLDICESGEESDDEDVVQQEEYSEYDDEECPDDLLDNLRIDEEEMR